ncbi:hypothetical protein F2Q69_00019406 [Brassica cretica]|uniref:Uncharacterized protein n=1 Tax=Brassica cretica TaxID=69181 RepID=A0A8S9QTT2_BRACR|nr:hypothetical protein F2Q69_00019406 [Brassica cretica]
MGCSFAFVTRPMRVCRFRWIRAELSKRGARILFREHSFSAVATPLPFSAAVSFHGDIVGRSLVSSIPFEG